MKFYEEFSEYSSHVLSSRNTLGFLDWTVVQVHDLDDSEKAQIMSHDVSSAKTACFITVVHAVKQVSETFLVCDNTLTADDIRSRCLDAYLHDIDNRILGVDPGADHGFTEYDSWSEFRDVWLVRDGKPVIPHIMPLLFDLPSDVEYLAWKKAGKIPLGNRRLLVTLYGLKKEKFYKIFVNNVQEEEIEQYQTLLRALRGAALNAS